MDTPARSRLQGIAFALAGFTMWVVADAGLKLAGESALPAYEIVAVQSVFLASILLVYRALRRDVRLLWPVRPARQLVRGCLDFGNVMGVAIALRHLPLTVFYVLVFTAPLVIAVGGRLFLQERLPWQNAAATLVGFAGIVVAVRPFSGPGVGDWIGYAACSVSVLCFSSSILWLRRMTQTERLDSLTFSSALVCAACGCLAMCLRAGLPSMWVGALLCVTGAAVGAGNYFSYRALRAISSAEMSQYHYSQLVSGGAVAWLVWHEVPTQSLLAGAALVAGAGAYVAARAGAGRSEAPPLSPLSLKRPDSSRAGSGGSQDGRFKR